MSDTTTPTTPERKYRTITLTDRPPVRIAEDDWPAIAHGRYHDYDGQYESQANRITDIHIRVRQHDDGRTIVYGIDDYTTAFRGERGWTYKAGVLLADATTDAIIDAIHTVRDTLIECGGSESAHIADAVRDCIADLPAEDL